jgi:hypothetical protein
MRSCSRVERDRVLIATASFCPSTSTSELALGARHGYLRTCSDASSVIEGAPPVIIASSLPNHGQAESLRNSESSVTPISV